MLCSAAAVDAAAGGLGGLTVLDITRVVAEPCCSVLPVDLDATVIKVEPPGDPADARTFPSFVASEGAELSTFLVRK